MLENKQLALFGFIISIGLILSTYLVTQSITDISLSNQVVKVRGYAEKKVISDFAIWDLKIKFKTKELKDGYKVIESNKIKVIDFLIENGLEKSEIKNAPIDISEVYLRDNSSYDTNKIDYYRFESELKIKTKKVQKISKLAIQIDQLIIANIHLDSSNPKFYFTQLASLKAELIKSATADAKKRAEILVGGSGSAINSLQAAVLGKFVIGPLFNDGLISPSYIPTQNSISTYESGDDINSIEKKASVVVTVDYSLKEF